MVIIKRIMPTIYLDECGYTGEDLLNKDQPFFVLASMLCDDQTAKSARRSFFSDFQGQTLKHSVLKRKKRNQEAVRDFLMSIGSGTGIETIVRFADKRFVASGKMVDLLIEPTVHDAGIDLYERGANMATSNLIYLCAPLAIGKNRFQRILDFFVKAVRTRQKHFYDSMITEIDKAIASSPHQEMAKDTLSFYQIAHREQGFKNLILGLPKNVLDLSLDFALDISSAWREKHRCGEKLQMVHDKSSNMSKQERIWSILTANDMPPAIVGYDRRIRKFPIGIDSVSFASDTDCIGLQLTDVLAGAVSAGIQWALGTRSPNDHYGKMIGEILPERMPTLEINGIFPSRDVTPEDLGTDGPKYEDPLLYTGLALRRANLIDK